jgi:hypothetical protein
MRSIGRLLAALVVAARIAAPGVAVAVCSPAATGIFPASGVVATSVTATVEARALAGATVTVIGDPGLTVTVQSSAPLALTLRLDIATDALPGERVLLLDTPGGSTGVSFTVNAAGGPVVGAVSPTLLATLGLPLDVTVTGANLAGVSPASFTVSGSGVAVSAATPSPDGTTLALTFTVDAAADLGTHAVTLVTPTGGAVLQLYVQRPPPLLSSVSPGAGEQGATVPLTLTGTNLTGAALVVRTPQARSAMSPAATSRPRTIHAHRDAHHRTGTALARAVAPHPHHRERPDDRRVLRGGARRADRHRHQPGGGRAEHDGAGRPPRAQPDGGNGHRGDA